MHMHSRLSNLHIFKFRSFVKTLYLAHTSVKFQYSCNNIKFSVHSRLLSAPINSENEIRLKSLLVR